MQEIVVEYTGGGHARGGCYAVVRADRPFEAMARLFVESPRARYRATHVRHFLTSSNSQCVQGRKGSGMRAPTCA